MHVSRHIQQAIREVLLLGAARAAYHLSQLVERDVTFYVHEVTVGRSSTVESAPGSTVISQEFDGPLRGSMALAFCPRDAVALASALSTEIDPGDTLDSASLGVLREASNFLINAVLSAISHHLEMDLSIHLPRESDPRLMHEPSDTPDEAIVSLAAPIEVVIEGRSLTASLVAAIEESGFEQADWAGTSKAA